MQNAVDTIIGKRLRIFRRRMSWPLKVLASKLDISIQQLQRYEQGDNKIPASTLSTIAQSMNVDINHFFKHSAEVAAEEKGFNIALVDGNASDAFFFQKAIMDFDGPIHLFSMHNGEEASRFFHTTHGMENDVHAVPDMIFLSVPLARAGTSNLCGLDLLQEIKRQPDYHATPVIMLAADISDTDILRAYRYNASGVIRKTFDFDGLKKQLHGTLNYWIHIVILPHHHISTSRVI